MPQTISGFGLISKVDDSVLLQWTLLPSSLEYGVRPDGTAEVRIQGLRSDWEDGKYKIAPVSWEVPDPPVNTMISCSTLLSRLTDVEYAGIRKAVAAQVTAGNGQMARWLDLAQSGMPIDVSNPTVQGIKGQLVSSGLLPQARADAVFAVP